MAFTAYEFTFNGKSCRQFGLIMYDFNGSDREGGTHTAGGKPQVETVFRQHRSLLRGVEDDEKLSFQLSFGLCPDRMERRKFLDRFEIERIAAWLTGHREWGWMTIEQYDLAHVRYRCIITDLKEISSGWDTYGFTCTVQCDSHYAYMFPRTYKYHCDSTLDIDFFSRSSMNQPYCPTIIISNIKSGDIAVVCKEDEGRGPVFKGLPNESSLSVTLDGTKEMLTSSTGQNLYPYFNFQFLRLYRGENHLTITGNCDLAITCEFPVDVGA